MCAVSPVACLSVVCRPLSLSPSLSVFVCVCLLSMLQCLLPHDQWEAQSTPNNGNSTPWNPPTASIPSFPSFPRSPCSFSHFPNLIPDLRPIKTLPASAKLSAFASGRRKRDVVVVVATLVVVVVYTCVCACRIQAHMLTCMRIKNKSTTINLCCKLDRQRRRSSPPSPSSSLRRLLSVEMRNVDGTYCRMNCRTICSANRFENVFNCIHFFWACNILNIASNRYRERKRNTEREEELKWAETLKHKIRYTIYDIEYTVHFYDIMHLHNGLPNA